MLELDSLFEDDSLVSFSSGAPKLLFNPTIISRTSKNILGTYDPVAIQA